MFPRHLTASSCCPITHAGICAVQRCATGNVTLRATVMLRGLPTTTTTTTASTTGEGFNLADLCGSLRLSATLWQDPCSLGSCIGLEACEACSCDPTAVLPRRQRSPVGAALQASPSRAVARGLSVLGYKAAAGRSSRGCFWARLRACLGARTFVVVI